MAQDREQLFSLFMNCLLVGIAGWLLETVLGVAEYGVIRDRGYLLLPICPIYSIGTFVVLVMVRIPKRTKMNILRTFLTFAIGATLFEGACGYLIQKFFGIELWSYLDWPLSLHYVSLIASVAWATFGTVYLFWVVPLVRRIAMKIPKHSWKGIVIVVFLSVMLDFGYTSYKAYHQGGYQPYYRIKVFERGITGDQFG